MRMTTKMCPRVQSRRQLLPGGRDVVAQHIAVRRDETRTLPARALTLWLVAALTALMTLSPGVARAEVAAGTRIADQSYPGIQLVVNINQATLTVPVPEIDPTAFRTLLEQLARQYVTGAIAPTDEAFIDAMVTEMAKAPLTYLRPTAQTRSTEAEVGGLGTGFAITPDGYIITAAHVVKDDPEALKRRMAEAGLAKFVEQDVLGISQQTDSELTDAQRKKFVEMVTVFNANYLTLSEVTQTVSVRFPEAAADGTKVGTLHSASIVSAGDMYPGKDYAILKVDGVSNLPTIPIGDDSEVVAGTTFYVAGFTGASTFFPGASEDSQNQPALTEGPVTSVKSNADGVPYFQTQAPAGHGNSGGPVMNDKGEAIGILVAGTVDNDGSMVEGQQWVLPIRVLKSELDNQSIKPKVSPTTSVYDQALTEYYAKHYKNAVPAFEEVEKLYPAHPYAKSFVQKSQSAINAGKDETPLPVWVWAAIAGAVVMVFGGAGGGIALAKRAKNRRQRQATVGGGQWPQQPGGQWQFGQPAPEHPSEAGYQPTHTQPLPGLPFGQPGQGQPVPYPPTQGLPTQGLPVQGLPVQGRPVQGPPVPPQSPWGQPPQPNQPAASVAAPTLQAASAQAPAAAQPSPPWGPPPDDARPRPWNQ